jgi:hypothetical protein
MHMLMLALASLAAAQVGNVFASNPNGDKCSAKGDCASSYCYPGPESQSYCIAAESNCAKPGTDGVLWGASYVFNGSTYSCQSGAGLVQLPASQVPDGGSCMVAKDCASNYCYPGPETKNYCIAAQSNCAKPGTPGILWNDSYLYNGVSYTCTYGKGLVASAAPKTANGLACGAPGDCQSNYCYPVPTHGSFCIAPEKNCARPGTDGALWNESFTYEGDKYSCVSGQGLIKEVAPATLADGAACGTGSECKSGYCYPVPGDRSYCIAKDRNCARPGTSGAVWNESFVHLGRALVCDKDPAGAFVGLRDLGRAVTVSPRGNVTADTQAIQAAINGAVPGDAIVLAPGVYQANCLRIRDKSGIAVLGLRDGGPVAQINWVGDTTNGDYRDPLIYDPSRNFNWLDWTVLYGTLDAPANLIDRSGTYASACGSGDSGNPTINTLTQVGLRLEGTLKNVEIRGLTLQGDGKARPRGHAGIYNNSGVTLDDIRIIDNRVSDVVNGIAIGGSYPQWPITNVTIRDNILNRIVGVLSGTGYGIQMEAFPSYDSNFRILDNTVSYAQRHSIYIGRGRKVLVQGNQILNHRVGAPNPLAATWLAAISIARSVGVTIENNLVDGFTDGAIDSAGIELNNLTMGGVTVPASQIGGYVFRGNTFRRQLSNGLVPPPPVLVGTSNTAVEAPPTGVVFDGNRFEFDVYNGGIQVQNVLGLDFVNNTFALTRNAALDSISRASTLSAVRVYGVGEIADPTAAPLFSDNLRFINNHIQIGPSDTPFYGFYLVSPLASKPVTWLFDSNTGEGGMKTLFQLDVPSTLNACRMQVVRQSSDGLSGPGITLQSCQ